MREPGKTPANSRSGAFYLWVGMLIPTLLVFLGFVVIKVWPFGNGTVLIIDSLHQYLPFYTDFHDKLVHHSSLFYSFSGGLGYDFWATYAYYLASPFNLLIALVPTANVGDFMDLMILLKIGACGGIFSWYLHKRNGSLPFMPLVCGTMYALGNFLIGYYFNLMWLDSIAVVPLIMYGIERISRGRGGSVYGLALLYGLWCNYYIGFMLCIFSCLYLVVCLVQRSGMSARQLVRRGLLFGWYSLLAGGASAVVLLPAYRALTASESMMSNTFPKHLKFYTDFLSMFISHFAAEHPINISDSQVGLNAYCGVSVLILVICWVLDSQIGLRKKISHLLLTLFLFMSVTVNYFNYMWHGFHTQNGLPNRFAFLYVLMLLILCYDVFPHLWQMPLWELLSAGLIPLALSLYAVMSRKTDWDTYGAWNYLTPALLCLYLLLLTALRLRRAPTRIFCILLGTLMIGEAACHGIYGICYNENVTRDIYLKDQASFKAMTKKAEGDSGEFYRAEIDSQRMRNVTIFAGGHSMVLFNSTMQESYTQLCDRIGIEARTNKNGYNGVTRLFNDLFGIRYVFSSIAKGDTLYGFEKIDGDGNLNMFYNPGALSAGVLVNPEIRYWDIEEGNPIDVQNSFVNLAAGMEDLYILDRIVEAKDTEENKVVLPEDKQVYIYLPDRISELKLKTPEYDRNFTTYTDHLYSMYAVPGNDSGAFTCNLKPSQTGETVSIYTCSNEQYEQVHDYLARSQLTDVKAEGAVFSGSIEADRDGILLLSLPYNRGWKVKMDAQGVEPLVIGDCLMGIEMPAGHHDIYMRFVPNGFRTGLLLTIICAALLALSILLQRRGGAGNVTAAGTGEGSPAGDGGAHAVWSGLLQFFGGECMEEKRDMQIRFAKRTDALGAGIFAQLNDRKEELLAQGRTIYNLSVGTPDFETGEDIRTAVSEAAKDPANYKYALRDLPQLKQAFIDFYDRRFGVTLEPDEVMSVYGSQEGMAHLAWALCDPGDVVLVPNPAYPIFKTGPLLCGAQVYEYALLAENNYLPDLTSIPEDILERARYMVVSYPGNPLGKTAPDSFYEELIAFAARYNIVIVHDNAYADIIFDGREGGSFLAFDGAKEVGVEFYSLSKTFDYTGARLSFVAGNRDIVQKFDALRSQFDYGIFLPVQYGGIAALNQPREAAIKQCEEYERRNHTLCEGLRSIGWDVPDSEGSMFVWAPLPKGYTHSEAFTMKLMLESGVIVTPGSSFGSLGEGYVRFALVLPCEELEKAVKAIADCGILNDGGTR